jgi:hypothetical protein
MYPVYTDDELYRALKHNKLKCGPVVESTRSFYLKKLLEHLKVLIFFTIPVLFNFTIKNLNYKAKDDERQLDKKIFVKLIKD